MKVLLIGLGRMGLGVAKRLHSHTEVFGFDTDETQRKKAMKRGVQVCASLAELLKQGSVGNRVIWLQIPAGKPVDEVLGEIKLSPNDIIVEAGNSHYQDSIRRALRAKEQGVFYLDVGLSGGIHGEKHGFCSMVGGDKKAFERVEKLFQVLSTAQGYLYTGPSGSGHYVKMVHNAIEYGILQVLGEGFWMLESSPFRVELEKVASVWNKGSVIRGWLVELVSKALSDREGFDRLSGQIGGGETGFWAVKDAMERKIPVPLIGAAFMERLSSRHPKNFAHKLVATLRREFGGHEVKLEDNT